MLFFKKSKQKDSNKKSKNSSLGVALQNGDDLIETHKESMSVVIESMPLDYKVDHSVLFEIKNVSVVSRLNEIIPAGTNELMQGVQKVKLQKVHENTDTLYTSSIAKESLTGVKDGSGGLRGFKMGKKGIKENAVLKEFDTSSVTQTRKVAAGVSKVMNVSSLIVGQYYMSEVNSKLIGISKDIKSIGNFQQQEFKSKILALINNIEEISKFSSEILDNDELRKRELLQLSTYKNDAVQLLGQVNITIQGLSNELIMNIQEYQVKVEDLDKLLRYQDILSKILEEISKLSYTLNLGKVSIEKCYSSYNSMVINSNDVRNHLRVWHQENHEKIGIELDNHRFKKKGVESIITKPLSLIDEKWDYKKLESKLISKIVKQTQCEEVVYNIQDEFFDKEVELIIDNGQYYYQC